MKNILFILPSWEERSFLGFKSDIDKFEINEVILFKYAKSINSAEVENNNFLIENFGREKGLLIQTILLPTDDVEMWLKIDSIVSQLNKDSNIVIDITTMSRNIIWMLLFFCRQKYLKITYTYYKPQCYNSLWISKDPDIPKLLFKHSGIIELGKPTSLLVLTGFDPERVIQLVNYYDPKTIVLGIQKGQQFENGDRNNREKYADLISKRGAVTFDIDAYSPVMGFEILNANIKVLLESSNLVVASLGPKTGAIPLYKCFIEHPEIALTHVPCKQYNPDYCKGIGETISGQFSF